MKKKESDEKKEPGVLEAYGQRTQTHGLHYVLNPHYRPLRRVLWAIVFTLSLLMFLMVTYEVMVKYFAFSVTVTSKEIHSSSLALPQVTICSHNPLKMTSLSDMGKYNSIKSQYQTTNDWRSAVIGAGENLTEIALNAGPNITSMILSCTFAGKSCDPTLWESSLTYNGRCYTLTGTNAQTAPGLKGGLNLVLNTESYDVSYDVGGVPGLKFYIHGAGARPYLSMDDGIDITPGFKANLKVDHKQTLRLPAPFTACNGHTPMASCFDNCQQSSLHSSCGCVPFDNTGTFATCTTKTQMTCVATKMNELLTKSNKCNCALPCIDNQWTGSSTFSQLSELVLARDLDSSANATMSAALDKAQTAAALNGAPGVPSSLQLRETVSAVNLFYPQTVYTKVTYAEAYSFMDHAKDHAIGLLVYFGASILSFVEVIDLVCVALASCFHRATKHYEV